MVKSHPQTGAMNSPFQTEAVNSLSQTEAGNFPKDEANTHAY